MMARARLLQPLAKEHDDSSAMSRPGGDPVRVAPRVFESDASLTERIQWYAPPSRPYTRRELMVDRCVNFGGALLSWIAAPSLCLAAWLAGDSLWRVAGFGAFGSGFIGMFTFSARYHYCCWDWTAKTLRPMDHVGINMMIMGSYTPPAQYVNSYGVLSLVWVLGLAGIALEMWRMTYGRQESGTEDTRMWLDHLNIARYLLMGWAVLLIVPDVLRVFPVSLWMTMLAGGLLFTLGVPFFLWESLEYHVAIWHSMVFLASSCFFIVQVQLVGMSSMHV
mmetsp:Transcript_27757/g.50711  ORF Transcript_27757/g.50711 Transcript_27757/m.50711 type:complete len:278 (-) Transcript_27757:262-1095(-)